MGYYDFFSIKFWKIEILFLNFSTQVQAVL